MMSTTRITHLSLPLISLVRAHELAVQSVLERKQSIASCGLRVEIAPISGLSALNAYLHALAWVSHSLFPLGLSLIHQTPKRYNIFPEHVGPARQPARRPRGDAATGPYCMGPRPSNNSLQGVNLGTVLQNHMHCAHT